MVKEFSLARAYDLVAPAYAAQLERNPVAVEMRRELHAHFDRVFHPGEHVLDFTAGTGMDALYLVARRISVTALDASPGMVAELRRNAQGLEIDARVLDAHRLGELDACFDGAISTFAGLNTIEDMPRLAHDLAACVKPHGHVILHALNAFCLWQAVAQRLGRGGRRDGEMRVGEMRVQHRLYHPTALWREAFAPYFGLREVYAFSAIAAPAIVTRWPRWAPLIFKLDRAAGKRFPSAGDFFVLDLERLDGGEHSNG